MSSPVDAQRLRVWRSLQGSALSLVAERGLAAVTVEDIAAAAGTSRRTFFNYFPTKASALFDPDPELAGRLAALLAAADAPADLWTALRWVCLEFTASGHEHVLPVRRRLVAEHPELGDYHAAAHRPIENTMVSWAAQQCPADPLAAQVLARTAMAVVAAAFLTWQPDAGTDEFRRLVERGFTLIEVTVPHPGD